MGHLSTVSQMSWLAILLLVLILIGQGFLVRKVKPVMAAIDDLSAKVAANTDVIESAIVLIQNIKALLDAAGTDPAKLAELSATLGAEDDKLAAAVAANTPTPPPAA